MGMSKIFFNFLSFLRSLNLKWPEYLVLIRHAESSYNAKKKQQQAHPLYSRFLRVYERDFAAAGDISWVSGELRELALKLYAVFYGDVGDREIPLSPRGWEQAQESGRNSRGILELPDIILVSSYMRAGQTLQGWCRGWPELGDVKVVADDRLREQEHGLCSLFGNWRIYYALHPEQGLLFKLLGYYDYRHLNGENKPDVKLRIKDIFGTIVREYHGKKIWIIAHHLTNLCVMSLLESWDHNKFLEADEQYPPANCGVTVYKGNPKIGCRGRLERQSYNQMFYKN